MFSGQTYGNVESRSHCSQMGTEAPGEREQSQFQKTDNFCLLCGLQTQQRCAHLIRRKNLGQWLVGLHCAPLNSPFTLVLEFSLEGRRAGTQFGKCSAEEGSWAGKKQFSGFTETVLGANIVA